MCQFIQVNKYTPNKSKSKTGQTMKDVPFPYKDTPAHKYAGLEMTGTADIDEDDNGI